MMKIFYDNKYWIRLLVLCLAYLEMPILLDAVSLDGTISPILIEYVYSFADGDYAKGFVKFARSRAFNFINGYNADVGGFTLPAGGSIEFGVSEVVEGDINLNGGTLNLTSDLYLRGNINGSGAIWLRGFTIHLLSDVQLNGVVSILTPLTSGVINCHNNILDVGGGNLFLAGGEYSTFKLSNAIVNNATSGTFNTQQGFLVNLYLENVTFNALQTSSVWEIDKTLYIQGNVTFNGTGADLVFYKASAPLTITTGATLKFGQGVTFEERAATYFESKNSTLIFENSILTGNQGNITWTKGTVFISGNVDFATGRQTFLGTTGVPSDDLTLKILPGSTLNLYGGTALVDNNSR
jgi:hypothetical protein